MFAGRFILTLLLLLFIGPSFWRITSNYLAKVLYIMLLSVKLACQLIGEIPPFGSKQRWQYLSEGA